MRFLLTLTLLISSVSHSSPHSARYYSKVKNKISKISTKKNLSMLEALHLELEILLRDENSGSFVFFSVPEALGIQSSMPIKDIRDYNLQVDYVNDIIAKYEKTKKYSAKELREVLLQDKDFNGFFPGTKRIVSALLQLPIKTRAL